MKGNGSRQPLPLTEAAWRRLEDLRTAEGIGPPQSQAAADIVEQVLSVASDIGVTRLANLTGLDFLGLPVWAAYRPNGFVLSLAGGKGLSHDQARASALCEAMELDVAERHLGQVTATIESLERQYGVEAVLPTLGVSRCSFNAISRQVPLRWSLGINLLDASQVWVPTELVALDDRKSSRGSSGGWVTGAFDVSSTGLGAGRDIESATLHALFELIEEDAMALWRYGARNLVGEKAVEPSSFGSEELSGLLTSISAAGASCRLFDATATDLGIPTIYAVIAGYPTGGYQSRLFGAGSCSHARADAAAIRAVLEAAQSRIAYISGARDDLPNSIYETGSESFPAAEWFLACPQTKQSPADFLAWENDPRELIAKITTSLATVGVGKLVIVPIATSQSAKAGIEVVRLVADRLEIDTEGAARQLGPRGLLAFLKVAAGEMHGG